MTNQNNREPKAIDKPNAPAAIEPDGKGNTARSDQRAGNAPEGAVKGSIPADDTELKNPDSEFAKPAAMPRDQQGQGGHPQHHDLQGQQGGQRGGSREP